MPNIFHKLSTDQQKFAVYGVLSLLAVGIMIFLVHGLSGVSFQFNNSAAFERKQLEKETLALGNVWTATNDRTSFVSAAAAAFPENTYLATVATEAVVYRDALTDVLTEKSVEVPESGEVQDLPEDAIAACEQAFENEETFLDNLEEEIDRIGTSPELYGIFNTLKQQSETTYIPALQDCMSIE